MKNIFTFLMILNILNINAQNKRDYVWFLADDHMSDTEGIQALKIDFNQSNPEFIIHDNGVEFDQNNASICDNEGRLLFYTNGCAVADATHNVMSNGHDINDGDFLNLFWGSDCSEGYPGRQDITILPHPFNSSKYYIVHKPLEFNPESNPPVYNQKLSYSLIDLEFNQGIGKVVEKNMMFYSGRILWSYLTTIAHKNQQDWWIIQPKEKGNCFLQFSLDEQGFSLIDSTCLGSNFQINSSASGDAKFSPDGKLYAYYNAYDQLKLFDFDRTSGSLSNLRQINIPVDTSFVTFSSIEFSPDSRFLYFAITDSLWQLDLHEPELIDGLEFIDSYDGYLDPFPTTFFLSTLAPNCKIYIRPGSGSYSMHVINKPNEKGKACDFQQHSIKLPLPTARGGFPNFPRFRVDEDEVCDPNITSVFDMPVYVRKELSVSPNPTSGIIQIKIPDSPSGYIRVIDINGREVIARKNIQFQSTIQLTLSDLASGHYSVEFLPKGNQDERVIYTNWVHKI